jgi:hypothetical protein
MASVRMMLLLLLFNLLVTIVTGQIPGFKIPGASSLSSLKTDDKYLFKGHLAGNEVKLLKLPGDSASASSAANGLVGGITSGIANAFSGSNVFSQQQPQQQVVSTKSQYGQGTPVISSAVQVCNLIVISLVSEKVNIYLNR